MAYTVTLGYSHASGGLVTPSRLNTAISGLVINLAAKKLLGTTGAGAAGEIAYTDYGLSVLQATDEAAFQALVAAALFDTNLELSVLQLQQLRRDLVTGYSTSGAISLNMSAGMRAKIVLAGDATFSVAGMSGGLDHVFWLKNGTAGTINLTWPAWTTPAGVTLPATLAAGASMLLRLEAFGTTAADVVASYN
jgi:hypothetical protein